MPETVLGQKRAYTESRTLIEHRTELIGVATRPTPGNSGLGPVYARGLPPYSCIASLAAFRPRRAFLPPLFLPFFFGAATALFALSSRFFVGSSVAVCLSVCLSVSFSFICCCLCCWLFLTVLLLREVVVERWSLVSDAIFLRRTKPVGLL